MLREEESICYCQEQNLEAVAVEQLEEPPGCIVYHPGFQAVCLNVWVLQTAWLQYKQQYGSKAHGGPEHQKKSSHSLQAVSEVVLGVLRIRISGALPSCAVNCIRTHFPEPNRPEVVFLYSTYMYKWVPANLLLG